MLLTAAKKYSGAVESELDVRELELGDGLGEIVSAPDQLDLGRRIREKRLRGQQYVFEENSIRL